MGAFNWDKPVGYSLDFAVDGRRESDWREGDQQTWAIKKMGDWLDLNFRDGGTSKSTFTLNKYRQKMHFDNGKFEVESLEKNDELRYYCPRPS